MSLVLPDKNGHPFKNIKTKPLISHFLHSCIKLVSIFALTGKLDDVVLGFDTPEEYKVRDFSFAATSIECVGCISVCSRFSKFMFFCLYGLVD